jgi:acetyl-CoA decarbonylase/synthase complex subunit gamma
MTRTKPCCEPAAKANDQICCGETAATVVSSASSRQNLAIDWLETPAGPVPRVSTELGWRDRLGTLKVRFGVGRMRYAVEPGLYAVGSPGPKAPVLVTANYKLTFDHVRRQLSGLDAWILALDTQGINVWCAAGKGSFGTEELVRRIEAAGLDKVVSHRRLIVPQLGAPGTSAHEVQNKCGFTVVYGPVRAKDLPAFLRSRRRATAEMRRVHFDLLERAVLIPVEAVMVIKAALAIAVGLALFSGFGPNGYSFARVMAEGWFPALILVIAALMGTILTPLLLPWLPGRAFAVKGAWLGLAVVLGILAVAGAFDRLETLAWLLFVPAMTSFVALNFTGASTYTNLSGVSKETAVAVPIQIACAVLAAGLWITGHFL